MKLALISDVHEDVETLELALSDIEKRGVDQIVCLGDMVGFSIPFYPYLKSRSANRTIDLIKRNCLVVVPGNHDLFAVQRLPTDRTVFDYPAKWYDLDFATRQIMATSRIFLYEDNELSALLSKENVEYLRNLPEYSTIYGSTERLFLSHYAFPDVTGCSARQVKDYRALGPHFCAVREANCDRSFSGNDHVPGVKIFTENAQSSGGFGQYFLDYEPTWTHGPAIARGTTNNGYMIYDDRRRFLEVVPLNSPLHYA